METKSDTRLEAIRQELRGLSMAVIGVGIAIAGAGSGAGTAAKEIGEMMAKAQVKADRLAKLADQIGG
jgi:hypothetical protein